MLSTTDGLCAVTHIQRLFPQDETKEHPHSFDEFFVSQIGTADGNNAGGFDTLALLAGAQQHHRRPRSGALQLANHAAAILKVILMDDDGINGLTRQKHLRVLGALSHQKAIIISPKRGAKRRAVFPGIADEQQRQPATHVTNLSRPESSSVGCCELEHKFMAARGSNNRWPSKPDLSLPSIIEVRQVKREMPKRPLISCPTTGTLHSDRSQ